MKTKKILLVVSLIVSTFIIAIIQNEVFATDATTPLYLGITELRTNSEPNMGYAIGDPNTNQETGRAAKIWNILEYTGEGDNASLKADGHKNIYCVKAGVGFSDTKKRETYNVFYDMKTEREKIKQQNDVLKSIVEGTIKVDETTSVSKYDALLALGDMLYLTGESSESDKTALLEAAVINADNWEFSLTDDDIGAIQQVAIWYFTNYGEENGKYDLTSKDETWLYYTLDGNKYSSLSGYPSS